MPVIDETFRALIPPLSQQEREGLEAALVKDGCREPLSVWKENGHEVLIDGHHRFEICGRRSIPFKTTTIDLPNRNEVQIWIIFNQLSRRNLTDLTRVQLARTAEPLIKARGKEAQIRKSKSVSVKLPKQKVDSRKELAKMAGVSERTYDAGCLILDKADRETKERVRRNEVAIHRAAKDIKEASAKKARVESRPKAEIISSVIVGDFSIESHQLDPVVRAVDNRTANPATVYPRELRRGHLLNLSLG